MAKTGTTTQGLRTAIERSGYYPALVAEAVEAAVGGEPVASYLVHQETTFDANEVRRHVTVLVLTSTRFIVSHTDEQAADDTSPSPYATTSTESVKLARISSVVLSRVVANPESYTPGTLPREVVLTIGWGAVSRLDLEPAACGDPNCEADHGYTGSSTADDLSLRVSEAGDGPETVRQALAFAQALSEATAATPRLRRLMVQPAPAYDPAPLDPRTAPAPRYGTASLSDVLPAVTAGLGVTTGPPTGLDLAPADRVCVFLVDGMGWELLRTHPDEAPFLNSLLGSSLNRTGQPLTAGFPSTTATSLASVGTGLPPGAHGLAGYTVLDPASGVLMNQLRWQPWTDPYVWQPYPTVFQLADAAGVETCQVTSPTFQHTPLTKIALSGGTFHGRLTGDERMDFAADRLAAADRALVYTYYSELDSMGHRHGVDSDAWRGQLMMIDRLAQRLAEQLPPRSALYITADHGMIDIPFDDESRIDFDEDWELSAGVAVLGGEARARHVYAVPGAASDVYTVWSEVLGEQMWVAGRDEAIAAGWFGPHVDERVRGRIGDVVAVARDDIAIVHRTEPGESSMVGLHGSMAPGEQLVPLLEVRS